MSTIKKTLILSLMLSLFFILACQEEVAVNLPAQNSPAPEASVPSLDAIKLPEDASASQKAENALKDLGEQAKVTAPEEETPTTTSTTISSSTTTTAQNYGPCKSISDGFCPQTGTLKCTPDNDYDCCTSKGLCWAFVNGECTSICTSDTDTTTTTTSLANTTTTTTTATTTTLSNSTTTTTLSNATTTTTIAP